MRFGAGRVDGRLFGLKGRPEDEIAVGADLADGQGDETRCEYAQHSPGRGSLRRLACASQKATNASAPSTRLWVRRHVCHRRKAANSRKDLFFPQVKILLVLPGFSAHERDWCLPALLDYVRALAGRADVHVAALRWPERGGTYSVFGASVHALDGRKHLGLRAVGLWARAVQVIAREHRRRPFDVVHAFWADEPGWVAAWAGRRLGAPVVVSLAGGELVGLKDIGYGMQLLPASRLLIAWSLRRAACITAGSEYMLRLARAHLREPARSRLVRAPLGVDTARFCAPGGAPRPKRDTASVVLNVGSLVPVKGQAHLLRAFARAAQRVGRRNLRLRIVGGGPLRPALQSEAGRLGVAPQVEFSGEVDHGQMPAQYLGAAACVQASRHEAQGMASLEAAACGLHVAGTAVGVLPEFGPAAPVEDQAALADLICHVVDAPKPDLREHIAAEYSLSASLSRFLELYRRLC